MLCICLTGQSLSANYEVIKGYNNMADLFELRYDLLKYPEPLTPISQITELPVIFTIRLPRDGGGRKIEPDEFRSSYIQAIQAGFQYIDLHLPEPDDTDLDEEQLKSIAEQARKAGVNVIRSLHYMESQPENVHDLFKRITDSGGDIHKLAVRPKGCLDLLQLFQLADRYPSVPKIIIGMGEYGFPTRVLSRRMGSLWSYSTPASGHSAAPGHISPEVLVEEYEYKQISGDETLLCVIGNPIMHTKSPSIHNPELRRQNLSYVYIPVTVDRLEDFFTLADYLNIHGVSVTVPYKERVPVYCRTVSEPVKETGASNTLVRGENGWEAHNTDIDGFIIPFKKFIGSGLSGMKITVIGAGGGGKGVVYALKNEGADILILNRTADKAEKLAVQFGCRFGPLSEESIPLIREYCDAIVQTTNCGMEKYESLDPLSFYEFTGREKIYDIIYNPPVTKMMKRGIEAGCSAINGSEMLLEQAKEQFRLYTGSEFG